MKSFIKIFLVLVAILGIVINVHSEREKVPAGSSFKSASFKADAKGCPPSAANMYLDINNVRSLVYTGGDMWHDFSTNRAAYYIPANSTQTSLFSGALWIGGVDVNDQLKLAAQQFRQGPDFKGGVDYWTGPLNITTANTDPETCAQYDQFFPISRAEVDEFIAWFNSDNKDIEFPNYQVPSGIKKWPAHGDLAKGQSFYLAPFKDVDGDGIYDYNKGDYPYYDITNELCPKGKGKDYKPEPTMETVKGIVKGGRLVDQVIKGDKTLWWVFNDKGNIHTESKGDPIGLEIRAQAFAFSTNDDINNMTFYSYEIINRSTYRLKDTYFGPWFDPDLGFADDDYVGCDVARGMGYCYNGKSIDGSGELWAYGAQPPAIGIDFFQGPYLDPDGVDNPKWNYVHGPDGKIIDSLQVCDESINGVNFGNGIPDDERFGMRRFVYYDNGTDTRRGGPKEAQHYYNYLRGIWLDNAKLSYGGTGHTSDANCVGPACDFMFPGDSDPCNWGTGGLPPQGGYNVNGKYWTEETAPNAPADRRFIQSAGPFTLEPGACNYITIGIPWARATSGGAWASVELLRTIDDKCQDLFDNCFKVLDGPAAPDMTFIENNQQLIVTLTNGTSSNDSNNYNEEYREIDPSIKTPAGYKGPGKFDSVYKFQGYHIYQLKNAQVSVDQLYDTGNARLVAQFDVKDGVSRIVNYTWNSDLEANVPMLMTNGNDNGISHSFVITSDAFSTTTNNNVVNYKQYYYMAVAYAYNPSPVYSDQNLQGIKNPFLLGRKNIKLYTAIPHPVGNGIIMNSQYGDKVTVTRLDGHGNGGMELELSRESVAEILKKQPFDESKAFDNLDYYPGVLSGLEYAKGQGPIDVKVIDPLKLKEGDFVLKFIDAKQKVVMRHYDSIKINSSGTLIPINSDKNTIYKEDITLDIETSKWIIYSNGDLYLDKENTKLLDTIRSEQLLSLGNSNEQLVLDLGISVNMRQVYNTGDVVAEKRGKLNKSGVLSSVMVFADSSKMWLSGVPDASIPESPQNWIRSGGYIGAVEGNKYNDFNYISNPGGGVVNKDGDTIWSKISVPWDKNGNYGKMVGGIIAPYVMCATVEQNPMGPVIYKNTLVGACEDKPEWFDWGYETNRRAGNVEFISSIDLVITPDKNKWTRSVVLEMCDDPLLSEGGAVQFGLRKAKSVDKNGNTSSSTASSSNPEDPNYINSDGMGWFPGYAINIETGERLNIMFGENSFLIAENGRDMQWNPSKNMYSNAPDYKEVFGGQHYVYVMSHRTVNCRTFKDFVADNLYMPPYDASKTLRGYFNVWNSMPESTPQTRDIKKNYHRTIMFGSMYVYMPLWNAQYKWLDNEATIKLRVTKPFARYYSLDDKTLPFREETLYPNDGFPMYKFSTKGMGASKSIVAFEDDMNEIRVVPNPYNAYSSYETSPIDTRVKIINLPDDCLVSIYNVAGTLVKQYQFVGTTIDGKQTTYLEWNLKNFAEIPIAGGLYYIHVKAKDASGNTKEKVVKWFGSLRVPDVNTF